MRTEMVELCKQGAFPHSAASSVEQVETYERLLGSITPPVTDDEARELVKLFGPDDYYGLAWTLIHLTESSPSWPIKDCLKEDSNQLIAILQNRIGNSM